MVHAFYGDWSMTSTRAGVVGVYVCLSHHPFQQIFFETIDFVSKPDIYLHFCFFLSLPVVHIRAASI